MRRRSNTTSISDAKHVRFEVGDIGDMMVMMVKRRRSDDNLLDEVAIDRLATVYDDSAPTPTPAPP